MGEGFLYLTLYKMKIAILLALVCAVASQLRPCQQDIVNSAWNQLSQGSDAITQQTAEATFDSADTNGDGKLDATEIRSALATVGLSQSSQDEVVQFLDQQNLLPFSKEQAGSLWNQYIGDGASVSKDQFSSVMALAFGMLSDG